MVLSMSGSRPRRFSPRSVPAFARHLPACNRCGFWLRNMTPACQPHLPAPHAQGDLQAFDQVVEELTSGSAQVFGRLAIAFGKHASLLARCPQHSPRLLAPLRARAWAEGLHTARAVAYCMYQLVSVNSSFLQPCLDTLVHAFKAQSESSAVDAAARPPAGQASTAPAAVDAEAGASPPEDGLWPLREVAMAGLQATLAKVPTAGGPLFAALVSSFPHKSHSEEVHRSYVACLLALSRRVPTLRDRVLALVLEKMVDLDVEIVLGPTEAGDDTVPAANKLDTCLSALLRQLDEWCSAKPGIAGVPASLRCHMLPHAQQPEAVAAADSATPPSAAAQSSQEHLFAVCLAVFERSVLLAQRCKYVQFTLFYLCRLSVSLTDQFVGRLISHLQSDALPTVSRAACAAYAAGFLARAGYVSDTTLRSALWLQLQWMHKYIDHFGGQVSSLVEVQGAAASAAPRGQAGGTEDSLVRNDIVFYAVVQSVLYTVVFHAASLQGKVGGLDFLRYMQWGRVVGNRLDPLRYCARDVASEFLRVAQLLDLAPQEDLARSSVYASLAAGGSAEASGADSAKANPVSSFFPFDPLLLRQSSGFVGDLYRHWHAVTMPGLAGGTDEEDDEEEGGGGATTDDGAFASFVSEAEGSAPLPGASRRSRMKRRRSDSSLGSATSRSSTSGSASAPKRPRRYSGTSDGSASASWRKGSVDEGDGDDTEAGLGELDATVDAGVPSAMMDAVNNAGDGVLARRLRALSFDEGTYNAMTASRAPEPQGRASLLGGIALMSTARASYGGGGLGAVQLGLADHPSPVAEGGDDSDAEEGQTPGLPFGGGVPALPVPGVAASGPSASPALDGVKPPNWDVFVALMHNAADAASGADTPTRPSTWAGTGTTSESDLASSDSGSSSDSDSSSDSASTHSSDSSSSSDGS